MPAQRFTPTTIAIRGNHTLIVHKALSWESPESVRRIFYERLTQGPHCWNWTGKIHYSGYGMLRVDGTDKTVHRISWRLHRGPIPEGLCVCHQCDNRRCVNPDHLFIGSSQQNMDDAKQKGRIARQRGEINGNSRLTNAQVLEIRARIGISTGRALAREYGVDPSMISLIKLRKEWAHI